MRLHTLEVNANPANHLKVVGRWAEVSPRGPAREAAALKWSGALPQFRGERPLPLPGTKLLIEKVEELNPQPMLGNMPNRGEKIGGIKRRDLRSVNDRIARE
jgi:hypothetical protein